jgi:hypothetical protein
MKKVFTILAIAAIAAVSFSSCAKKCNCTRYEDGKKVAVQTSDDVKYYEKDACTRQSESSYQGLSIVTAGKEVSVEIKCK